MAGLKAEIRRIGKLAWLALALGAPFSVGAAGAADISFIAQPDRQEISQDDSLAVHFIVTAEGSVDVGEVRFRAPDFDAINEYSSTSVKSFYDSSTGRFGMTNSRKLTKVLRARRTGRLTISGIQVTANGKTLSAPDIVVEVVAAGQATPPPRGYGGSGVGLRGAGKRTTGADVLLRAEINKDRVYKGEQVIVSYYLYRRVRMFNFNIDKFPELKGFLREELEMPVMGQRLDSDRVVVDGVPFERSLLVRYAAYPLQEGRLRVDPLGLKYNYYSGTTDDGEDLFLQYFQQLTPKTGVVRSEPVSIEVLPLPSEDRPASFSGGVGDFNVVAAVDKYELRANEALTLTVKVEGRGNVAAIGEPKVKWPDNMEFYDSKGQAKSAPGGVGTKIFEFVLIPRTAGKHALPPIEFSFFDPKERTYATRLTEPIELTVHPAAPGSASSGPSRTRPAVTSPELPKTDEVRDLKIPVIQEAARSGDFWKWLYAISAAGSLAVAGWIGISASVRNWRKWQRSRGEDSARSSDAKTWASLRELAKGSSGAAWLEVSKAYDTLGYQVFDAIDQIYSIGARSLSRSELRELLVVERSFPESLWDRVGRLLEFGETVRFASSLGAVSEQTARQQLGHWVKEAESIVRLIEQQKSSKS